jgi:hypothetical protein
MSIVPSPSYRSLTYLGHFQRGNLVESTGTVLNLAEVFAENPRSGGIDTIVFDTLVTELGLVACESNASSIAAVVLRSESDKSAPTASNVKVTITGLKSELLADGNQLVVLELLKSFLVLEILDDTAGVDHARAEEPEISNDEMRALFK